jgi:DNA invertase Pin-like site-specific DNA recombinase
MKIAAAYIRVSTDDQIEYSPESQIKAIREFAKRNNYILPDEYIFMDEGISGKSIKKRTEFQRMIGTAKTMPKPFDAILLWKFSRFARNREDSIVYKSMLRKQLGIDVISISENLGDDKMSILFEAMIEAMDEYYSINLAEEVKRGMTEKANRGEPLTIPPFGYSMKDKKLIPHPEEATIIKMIFNDYANGVGKMAIARKINTMGVRTHRGNQFENRTVDYILNNPVYIGKIRWNPTGHTDRDYNNENLIIKKGTHEAIISDELWDKVQALNNDARKKHKKHQRDTDAPSHIFQGIIKCSRCGSTLIYSAGGIQCHLYSKGRCDTSHYISIKKIESIVLNKIQEDFATGNINIIPRTPENINQNNFILKRIEREEQKLLRVKLAFEKGIDTIEEYAENKKRIQEEISSLKLQLTSDAYTPDTNAINKKFVQEYSDLIVKLTDDKVTIADKNAILKKFVSEIVYNKKAATVDITYFL